MITAALLFITSYVSIAAVIGLVGSILALVVAWFTLIALPDDYKKYVINGALAVLAGSVVYQFAYARGAYVHERRIQAAIAAVEKAHKAAAAKINAEQARMRREADTAIAQANQKLKDLEDGAKKGPNPVCVDRGLARRLRNL